MRDQINANLTPLCYLHAKMINSVFLILPSTSDSLKAHYIVKTH